MKPSNGNSGSERLRGASWLLGLIVVAMTFGAGAAEARKQKSKALLPAPADLPGHVNYLARQLYGVPLDESEPITSQIQKLVIEHLSDWLSRTLFASGPGDVPLDVKVRRELENAFSKLHYPLFGQPAVFAQTWKGGTLIGAGYTLGWTDYDRLNVLALFENHRGKAQLAAVTHFVPRTDLHYVFLPAEPDAFRFFVYGMRLGKSHPRLSVALYAFDGDKLESQWESRDIYDGKLEVGKEKVVVRYLKEDEYVREVERRHKPPRHQSTYKITATGLELQDDHEIPF